MASDDFFIRFEFRDEGHVLVRDEPGKSLQEVYITDRELGALSALMSAHIQKIQPNRPVGALRAADADADVDQLREAVLLECQDKNHFLIRWALTPELASRLSERLGAAVARCAPTPQSFRQ